MWVGADTHDGNDGSTRVMLCPVADGHKLLSSADQVRLCTRLSWAIAAPVSANLLFKS